MLAHFSLGLGSLLETLVFVWLDKAYLLGFRGVSSLAPSARNGLGSRKPTKKILYFFIIWALLIVSCFEWIHPRAQSPLYTHAAVLEEVE